MPTQSEVDVAAQNDKKIFQVFQNVQFNAIQHKKYIKELSKLYETIDKELFKESILSALQHVFNFGEANSNVDRIITFVASFSVALEDEDFLLFIFEIIFNNQCVVSPAMRYRASQLLAAVLGAMGEDACLDDDLCQKLLASQLERLQDTRSCVRCRATLALQRLQDPSDVECPVTRAYRFHMSSDPSPSVRRAVVLSIAKCSRNLPFVLDRLSDVDESVRRAAFVYVASINVNQLRIKQRVHTLKVGLTERSARVKKVVEQVLIPGWLSTFKGNILDLLTAVRLDNVQGLKDSHYVAGKLLESLFKSLPTSELLEWLPLDKELRLIPADKLNKESAWYWRHLALHLANTGDDETLEAILPDLPILTGYIRAIVESACPSEKDDPVSFVTRQYVLHELATLLTAIDTADQIGRQALQQLIFDVLTGDHGPLNIEVREAFVKALDPILPTDSERVEFLVSVLAQLRDDDDAIDNSVHEAIVPVVVPESTEIKIKRARLRVELNIALEEQEEAVREQNYELASKFKEKVIELQRALEQLTTETMIPEPVVVVEKEKDKEKEKSTDPVVLNRCLEVINLVLDSPKINTVTPMLRLIFQEFEMEIFHNPDVLENAIHTLALYAMLDAQMAREHVGFFFKQLVQHNMERPALLALQAIIDLMIVHGVTIFQNKPVDGADVADKNSVTHENDASANFQKGKKRLYDASQTAQIEECEETSVLIVSTHDTVIELILNFIDSECADYRLIVVAGLCRLVYLGRLSGGGLLSRLLLLWFNPATEDDDELRQTLGLFFQTFAETVPGAHEQLQAAVLPTLKAIARAPASSPLAELNQDALIKFIASITRIDNEQNDNHGSLAMLLVSSLVDRVAALEVPLICRLLSLLVAPRDGALINDLIKTLEDVMAKLPDKQSMRYVGKYLNQLVYVLEFNTRPPSINSSMSTTVSRMTRPGVRVEETIEEEPEIDESSPPNVENTNIEGPQVTSVDKNVASVDKNLKSIDKNVASVDKNVGSVGNVGEKVGKEGQNLDKGNQIIVSSQAICDEVPCSQNVASNRVRGNRKKKLTKMDGDKEDPIDSDDVPEKQTEPNAKPKPKRGGRNAKKVPAKTSRAVKAQSDGESSEGSMGRATGPQKTQKRMSNKGGNLRSSLESTSSSETTTSPKRKTKKIIEQPNSVPRTRRSTRSTRSSVGVNSTSTEDTVLHTIVYDEGCAQSLLQDSCASDSNATSGEPRSKSVVIPESPESSDSELKSRRSSARPTPSRLSTRKKVPVKKFQ